MIPQTSDSEPTVRVMTLTGAAIDAAVYDFEPEIVAATCPAPRFTVTKADDVITDGDAAALSWYFDRGIGIYERSTFGAIIDRLKYGSMGSHACARCDGAGILEDGGFRVDDKCRRCKGEGSEPGTTKACAQCLGTRREASYQVTCEKGGWCGSCRGTGVTSIDRRGTKPPACGSCGGRRPTKLCKRCGTCRNCIAAAECRNCKNCLGTGTEPLSVRPLGIDGDTGRDGADDAALTKFALTSRRLERVKAMSPQYHRAGVTYFGDLGTRWGLTERGPIFALFALTGPGKKLGRMAVSEKERVMLPENLRATDLTLHERIGVQATLDKLQPRRERTALLDAAGEQAPELYRGFAKCWNAAPEGEKKSAKRVTRSLIKRATKLGLISLANDMALRAGGAK